jgi:hypothetical protein
MDAISEGVGSKAAAAAAAVKAERENEMRKRQDSKAAKDTMAKLVEKRGSAAGNQLNMMARMQKMKAGKEAMAEGGVASQQAKGTAAASPHLKPKPSERISVRILFTARLLHVHSMPSTLHTTHLLRLLVSSPLPLFIISCCIATR